MIEGLKIFEEVEGLYRIIPLMPFRHTEGVKFDIVPGKLVTDLKGIDLVVHDADALSPGSVGDVQRPWYMHPSQEDNLVVMQGIRYTDIYTPQHGNVEHFEVAPNYVKKNGQMLYDGVAMLTWPPRVFHRIVSCADGSASINLARRGEDFDIKTNFNIYDLDTETGEYEVIRAGHLDQT